MTTTARQAPADARGWLQGVRFSWFAFVMIGLLVLAVLVIAPTVRTYAQQQGQITALRQQNSATQQKVTALQRQEKDWKNSDYVKAQARDRLLYVMPGETSYLIIDDLPKSQAGQGSANAAASARQDQGGWAATLLRSILRTPAPSAGTVSPR